MEGGKYNTFFLMPFKHFYRYDYVFLMAELARKTNTTPGFVCNGSTIISATLKLKGQIITFRDSAQYTKMRLASMPKAFGLHIDSKGYFPYLLNFPESYGKKWPTKPPKHYYNPEFMSSDEVPAFENWYEETFHEPFDFDEEILRYCLNDTEILTHGVCKFIQVFFCAAFFNSFFATDLLKHFQRLEPYRSISNFG